MKKIVQSVLVALLMLSPVGLKAETRILGFQKADDGYKYQFRLDAGVAWYHDNMGFQEDIRFDPDPTDSVAIYLQTPAAEVGPFSIGFGGICPLRYAERSRPEFSLNYIVGGVQLGAYWAVSPYNAFGLMVGHRF